MKLAPLLALIVASAIGCGGAASPTETPSPAPSPTPSPTAALSVSEATPAGVTPTPSPSAAGVNLPRTVFYHVEGPGTLGGTVSGLDPGDTAEIVITIAVRGGEKTLYRLAVPNSTWRLVGLDLPRNTDVPWTTFSAMIYAEGYASLNSNRTFTIPAAGIPWSILGVDFGLARPDLREQAPRQYCTTLPYPDAYRPRVPSPSDECLIPGTVGSGAGAQVTGKITGLRGEQASIVIYPCSKVLPDCVADGGQGLAPPAIFAPLQTLPQEAIASAPTAVVVKPATDGTWGYAGTGLVGRVIIAMDVPPGRTVSPAAYVVNTAGLHAPRRVRDVDFEIGG